jgi:hypothetical protein
MTMLLTLFGLAVAAFCVWLTVRIVNRRERWAKWTLVGLVVVLVGYPLSIGPLVYLVAENSDSIPEWGNSILEWYLLPQELVKRHGPAWLQRLIENYEMFWDRL